MGFLNIANLIAAFLPQAIGVYKEIHATHPGKLASVEEILSTVELDLEAITQHRKSAPSDSGTVGSSATPAEQPAAEQPAAEQPAQQ